MKLLNKLSKTQIEEIEEVLLYAKLSGHPILTLDIMKIYQEVILKRMKLQVAFSHGTDMFCMTFNEEDDTVTMYYYPEDEPSLTVSTYGGITFSSSVMEVTILVADIEREDNLHSLVNQLNEYIKHGVIA